MKASEVIEILNGAIAKAKEDGVEQIALEDLAAFGESLKKDSEKTPENVRVEEALMEEYKIRLSGVLAENEQRHASGLEMLRATVSSGQAALQSALLINGGASAALLAFIGSIWSGQNAQQQIPAIAYALSQFVWGVLVSAVAAGFTYLSQSGFGEEWGKASKNVGQIARLGAVLCVIAAYVLFGRGSWLSYVAFVGG